MPTVFIKTYGCQMNERDSEAVAAQLAERGYSLAASAQTADVVLLNTCSVRDLAEQKAIGKMTELAAKNRKTKGNAIFGYLGCMAQSRGAQLVQDQPDVRLVLGTQKFHRAADYLDELVQGRQRSIVDTEEEVGSQNTIKEHLTTLGGKTQITSFVSIMQGCNQYCTFCIVPYTRGQERSRPIAEIVEEVRRQVVNGAREVTLLGQIVNSYAKRELPFIDGKSPFVQLLEAVSAVEGIERVRFTSPHPKGYGDDLVEAYARLPKLCQSAHIPVQSGSNRILKLMHRGYTTERFLELVGKLRAARPDIGLTTDIIVGFPGETEEDFDQTLTLAREVRFDNAYMFKYSPRRDTPAAAMEGQLSDEVKEDRLARLLNVINTIGAERYETCVGRRMEILVEGPSKRNPLTWSGRTRCNKIVVFDGSNRHLGQLMDVDITRNGSFTLYGDPAILNGD